MSARLAYPIYQFRGLRVKQLLLYLDLLPGLARSRLLGRPQNTTSSSDRKMSFYNQTEYMYPILKITNNLAWYVSQPSQGEVPLASQELCKDQPRLHRLVDDGGSGDPLFVFPVHVIYQRNIKSQQYSGLYLGKSRPVSNTNFYSRFNVKRPHPLGLSRSSLWPLPPSRALLSLSEFKFGDLLSRSVALVSHPRISSSATVAVSSALQMGGAPSPPT